MNEDQIDQKVLEGEQAGVPMSEQPGVEDPLKDELNQKPPDVSEQAAAEELELKPEEEQKAKETPAVEEVPAAEEKPVEGQQDIKVDGAFANMRRENATLRAQIQAQQVAPQQQAVPAAPPEKSPKQVYLAENPDAEFFPPSVDIAQDEWKAEQSAKAVESTRQSTELETVTKSLNDSLVAITDETHGAGLQALQRLGSHLLTPNDNARIYMAGPEAGEQLHSILTKRVKDAGLYPQASSVKTTTSTQKVDGTKQPATEQEQQQTQSEEPELDEHNARICDELHLSR